MKLKLGALLPLLPNLLGFDENAKPRTTCIKSGSKVVTKTGPDADADADADADIATKAHTFLQTLVDLAEHEKYLKTAAVHGVSSGMIDYTLVLVNS